MFRADKMTDLAHVYASLVIKKGDTVVDATAGNGLDTVCLAKLVGERGKVYAFDIQEQALKKTLEKLKAEKLESLVELLNYDHQYINEHVSSPVSFIIYNLGYLPGGDKEVTTKYVSTLKSISNGLVLLKSGGVICVVIYSGHKEGALEKKMLFNYVSKLGVQDAVVAHTELKNRPGNPPELLLIQKTFQ